MWPFRRRRKTRLMERTINVPLPILIRQVVYDSIFDSSQDISNLMGLPPVSDEVHEMEQRASDDRISRFSGLIPFIDAHADISAQVSTYAYLLEADKDRKEFADEEALEELTKLFKLISMSASMSCISTLMDLGLLDTEVVSDYDE
jgi:hypothetical protein